MGSFDDSEVLYLSNCEYSDSHISSEMNYYRHLQRSQNGELPDATTVVMFGANIVWERQHLSGRFRDGNTFRVFIDDHDGPNFSIKGYGSNDYHGFTCRQDSVQFLYKDVATNVTKTCRSIYYCQPGLVSR
jgi:hypothetical protein